MIKEIGKRIQLKMQSKMGVSIIFGLFAFLIASALSITILSASMSAMKRLENFDDSQKSQALLTSTANALISITKKAEVTIECDAEEYYGNENEIKKAKEDINEQDPINKMIKRKMLEVINYHRDSDETDDNIKIECDDKYISDKISINVQVLNKDSKGSTYITRDREKGDIVKKYQSNHDQFELIYTLILKDNFNNNKKIYVTMKAKPNPKIKTKYDEEEGIGETIFEIKYTWDRATISLENPK